MNQLRTLKSPFSVNYEVTPVCDLFCNFCFVGDTFDFSHPSINHVKNILDKIAEAEIFEVHLFGGEFFIYPHWQEVLRYAHNLGLFLSFVSNGTCITKDVVTVMKEYGIREGAISIHGPRHIHDQITKVPGTYDKALNALEACLDGGLNITVLSTFTHDNKKHLRALVEDLNQRRLTRSSLIYAVGRLTPYGRAGLDWKKNRLSLEDYLNLFPLLENLSKDFGIRTALGDAFPLCLVPDKYHYLIQGCWQGTGFGHICFNGDVKGCTVARGIYGNLLEQPLQEIWQGPGLEKFRSLKWLPKSCQNCDNFCGGGCAATRPTQLPYAPDEFLSNGGHHEN